MNADQAIGSFEKLRDLLLDQPWHSRCEIIPDYMPPYPREDTRPTIQIQYDDGTEYKPRLRYSKGPQQGYFWDIYGEDMQTIELAVWAISQAPAPVNVGPITFRIPLASAAESTQLVGEAEQEKR